MTIEVTINKWLREVCTVTVMDNGKPHTIPGVFLPEHAIEVKLQLEKDLGIVKSQEFPKLETNETKLTLLQGDKQ